MQKNIYIIILGGKKSCKSKHEYDPILILIRTCRWAQKCWETCQDINSLKFLNHGITIQFHSPLYSLQNVYITYAFILS